MIPSTVHSHGEAFASGTLAGTTAITSMAGGPLPFTITLKSADATRKIEISTDGGTEYFEPVYDKTTATMKVVAVLAPVSHVKVTAAIADTWSIR